MDIKESKRVDVIKILIHKVESIIESPQNQDVRKLWIYKENEGWDEWHGIPRSSSEIDTIPFTVDFEIKLWSEILKFNVEEFYTNPVCHLENVLKMMIYRFEQIQDHTPVERVIPIWLGVSFEPALCGSKTVYMENQSPWPDKKPILSKPEDIDRLELPEFKKSGLMPLALNMYNKIKELVKDSFEVGFPDWRRGPFGVACVLRGTENLLTDMLLNQISVHKLMRFITDARKSWVAERAKYLQQEISKGDLDNDEVQFPMLSPEQYEEFILPYEQELCEFHGGIRYWHSCGDTGSMVNSIRKIPQIDLFHIGPWTDLKKAKDVFGKDVAFEKCLMPTRDVQLASLNKMGSTLDEIRKILDGTSYYIRADGLDVIHSAEKDLEVIKRWADIARNRLTYTKKF